MGLKITEQEKKDILNQYFDWDDVYVVFEITKPLSYLPLKFYYQVALMSKTEDDYIYIKTGYGTGRRISTRNIKVLKSFVGSDNPEMKKYLEDLRRNV